MDTQVEVQKIMYELDMVLRMTGAARILDGVMAVKFPHDQDSDAMWAQSCGQMARK